MNSYLFEKIGESRRTALIDDAAAHRVAVTGRVHAARISEGRVAQGVLASLRRLLSGPDAAEVGFLPRLADYPTARH